MAEHDEEDDGVEYWDYFLPLPVVTDDIVFQIINEGAGWGEFRLTIDGARYSQRVSLMITPLRELRPFFDNLKQCKPARMVLVDEPGETEVCITPTSIEGKIWLDCWTSYPGKKRSLQVAVVCSAQVLWQSMYDNLEMLQTQPPAPRPSAFKRYLSVFTGPRGSQ